MGLADAGRSGRLPTARAPDRLPAQGSSRAVRALWSIRWKLGELLGWESPDAGLGSRVSTLRDRLPDDLRAAPSGPEFDALPFSSLYLLQDEFAAEIANRTVHGVLHLGWVPDERGGHRGQMAVLVKPNGLVRDRLHGCDQAVPAPDRVPGGDATDRAGVADAHPQSDARQRPLRAPAKTARRRGASSDLT